jgi:phosphatidate cytidylyltransferase
MGLVVVIFAPLGDLAESMIKRDLGVKDFGELLPGHGGVLDRFDSLLFCLPIAYYLALQFKIF